MISSSRSSRRIEVTELDIPRPRQSRPFFTVVLGSFLTLSAIVGAGYYYRSHTFSLAKLTPTLDDSRWSEDYRRVPQTSAALSPEARKLWIGSAGQGVTEVDLDDYSFESHTVESTGGALPSNVVRDVAQTNGALIVAGGDDVGGLAIRTGEESWSRLIEGGSIPGLSSDGIEQAAACAGFLFLLTKDGVVARYDRTKRALQSVVADPPLGTVASLAADSGGGLYLVENGRLVHLDALTGIWRRHPVDLDQHIPARLCATDFGPFVVTETGALLRLGETPGQFRVVVGGRSFPELDLDRARWLEGTAEAVWIFGADSRLARYDFVTRTWSAVAIDGAAAEPALPTLLETGEVLIPLESRGLVSCGYVGERVAIQRTLFESARVLTVDAVRGSLVIGYDLGEYRIAERFDIVSPTQCEPGGGEIIRRVRKRGSWPGEWISNVVDRQNETLYFFGSFGDVFPFDTKTRALAAEPYRFELEGRWTRARATDSEIVAVRAAGGVERFRRWDDRAVDGAELKHLGTPVLETRFDNDVSRLIAMDDRFLAVGADGRAATYDRSRGFVPVGFEFAGPNAVAVLGNPNAPTVAAIDRDGSLRLLQQDWSVVPGGAGPAVDFGFGRSKVPVFRGSGAIELLSADGTLESWIGAAPQVPLTLPVSGVATSLEARSLIVGEAGGLRRYLLDERRLEDEYVFESPGPADWRIERSDARLVAFSPERRQVATWTSSDQKLTSLSDVTDARLLGDRFASLTVEGNLTLHNESTSALERIVAPGTAGVAPGPLRSALVSGGRVLFVDRTGRLLDYDFSRGRLAEIPFFDSDSAQGSLRWLRLAKGTPFGLSGNGRMHRLVGRWLRPLARSPVLVDAWPVGAGFVGLSPDGQVGLFDSRGGNATLILPPEDAGTTEPFRPDSVALHPEGLILRERGRLAFWSEKQRSTLELPELNIEEWRSVEGRLLATIQVGTVDLSSPESPRRISSQRFSDIASIDTRFASELIGLTASGEIERVEPSREARLLPPPSPRDLDRPVTTVETRGTSEFLLGTDRGALFRYATRRRELAPVLDGNGSSVAAIASLPRGRVFVHTDNRELRSIDSAGKRIDLSTVVDFEVADGVAWALRQDGALVRVSDAASTVAAQPVSDRSPVSVTAACVQGERLFVACRRGVFLLAPGELRATRLTTFEATQFFPLSASGSNTFDLLAVKGSDARLLAADGREQQLDLPRDVQSLRGDGSAVSVRTGNEVFRIGAAGRVEKQWEFPPSSPLSEILAVGAEANSDLLLVLGRERSGQSAVHRYDVSRASWTRLGSVPASVERFVQVSTGLLLVGERTVATPSGEQYSTISPPVFHKGDLYWIGPEGNVLRNGSVFWSPPNVPQGSLAWSFTTKALDVLRIGDRLLLRDGRACQSIDANMARRTPDEVWPTAEGAVARFGEDIWKFTAGSAQWIMGGVRRLVGRSAHGAILEDEQGRFLDLETGRVIVEIDRSLESRAIDRVDVHTRLDLAYALRGDQLIFRFPLWPGTKWQALELPPRLEDRRIVATDSGLLITEKGSNSWRITEVSLVDHQAQIERVFRGAGVLTPSEFLAPTKLPEPSWFYRLLLEWLDQLPCAWIHQVELRGSQFGFRVGSSFVYASENQIRAEPVLEEAHHSIESESLDPAGRLEIDIIEQIATFGSRRRIWTAGGVFSTPPSAVDLERPDFSTRPKLIELDPDGQVVLASRRGSGPLRLSTRTGLIAEYEWARLQSRDGHLWVENAAGQVYRLDAAPQRSESKLVDAPLVYPDSLRASRFKRRDGQLSVEIAETDILLDWDSTSGTFFCDRAVECFPAGTGCYLATRGALWRVKGGKRVPISLRGQSIVVNDFSINAGEAIYGAAGSDLFRLRSKTAKTQPEPPARWRNSSDRPLELGPLRVVDPTTRPIRFEIEVDGRFLETEFLGGGAFAHTLIDALAVDANRLVARCDAFGVQTVDARNWTRIRNVEELSRPDRIVLSGSSLVWTREDRYFRPNLPNGRGQLQPVAATSEGGRLTFDRPRSLARWGNALAWTSAEGVVVQRTDALGEIRLEPLPANRMPARLASEGQMVYALTSDGVCYRRSVASESWSVVRKADSPFGSQANRVLTVGPGNDRWNVRAEESTPLIFERVIESTGRSIRWPTEFDPSRRNFCDFLLDRERSKPAALDLENWAFQVDAIYFRSIAGPRVWLRPLNVVVPLEQADLEWPELSETEAFPAGSAVGVAADSLQQEFGLIWKTPRSPIPLEATTSNGRLPIDEVDAIAIVPDSERLVMGTRAGLREIDFGVTPPEESLFPVSESRQEGRWQFVVAEGELFALQANRAYGRKRDTWVDIPITEWHSRRRQATEAVQPLEIEGLSWQRQDGGAVLLAGAEAIPIPFLSTGLEIDHPKQAWLDGAIEQLQFDGRMLECKSDDRFASLRQIPETGFEEIFESGVVTVRATTDARSRSDAIETTQPFELKPLESGYRIDWPDGFGGRLIDGRFDHDRVRDIVPIEDGRLLCATDGPLIVRELEGQWVRALPEVRGHHFRVDNAVELVGAEGNLVPLDAVPVSEPETYEDTTLRVHLTANGPRAAWRDAVSGSWTEVPAETKPVAFPWYDFDLVHFASPTALQFASANFVSRLGAGVEHSVYSIAPQPDSTTANVTLRLHRDAGRSATFLIRERQGSTESWLVDASGAPTAQVVENETAFSDSRARFSGPDLDGKVDVEVWSVREQGAEWSSVAAADGGLLSDQATSAWTGEDRLLLGTRHGLAFANALDQRFDFAVHDLWASTERFHEFGFDQEGRVHIWGADSGSPLRVDFEPGFLEAPVVAREALLSRLAEWTDGRMSRDASGRIYFVDGTLDVDTVGEKLFSRDRFAWDDILRVRGDRFESAFRIEQVVIDPDPRLIPVPRDGDWETRYRNRTDLSVTLEATEIRTARDGLAVDGSTLISGPILAAHRVDDRLWVTTEKGLRFLRLEERWLPRLIEAARREKVRR